MSSVMTSLRSGIRQALALSALATLVLAASAAASTTVTTDPVGVVSYTVPQGRSVMSIPFLRSSVYQGTVASNTATAVTFSTSGIPDISAEPHYIHVLDGTYAGENITIVSATADSVVLELNTPGDLTGASVAIRPHFTIGSLFDGVNLPGQPTLALYETDGSIGAYTYFPGMGWRGTDFSPADDVIIYPGEGFVLNSGDSFSLPLSGSVSTSPVAVLVTSDGISIVGSVNPAVPVTIEGMDFVQALPDQATIGVYENVEGNFETSVALTKFDAAGGFRDTSFNLRNDYPLGVINGAVIRSAESVVVVIPPSYSSND